MGAGVTDPTLLEICQALADQIEDELTDVIPELQVSGTLITSPTPPAIDVYPADPFQEQTSFGGHNNIVYLAVRARVNTPDHEGAQELLLSMMDPRSAAALPAAVIADTTLGNTVTRAVVSAGPSDYGIYPDPSGQGAYLGTFWTVRVEL